MTATPIRVLLVEDEEQDYVRTSDLLASIDESKFITEWVSDYDAALKALDCETHDVCLLDDRLGRHTGLDLLREATARGVKAPVILLSDQADHEADLQVMKAGADNYLVKGEISPVLLERAIRYAIDRGRTLEALRASEERYALAIRGANDGLWDWHLSDNRIYFSQRWKLMLGYEEDEIDGVLEEWFGRISPDDVKEVRASISAHLLGQSHNFESEHRMMHKDGEYRWMFSRGIATRDRSGKLSRMAGSQTDITARKAAEERLLQQATSDSLTGLANRRYFTERLAGEIRSAHRYSYPLSLCLCDLDHFKKINDMHGHSAGDGVLVTFARILTEELRSQDLISRYGGDEFCVLLPHTRSAPAAASLERVRSRLAGTRFGKGARGGFTISATFGVAELSGREMDQKELLEAADQALYGAKELGRNRVKAGANSWATQQA